jgi:hypothetical protein
MTKKALLVIGLACFAFFSLRCTPDLAGGTIETTNGFVIGRMVDSQGQPAANARVVLLPALYNPVADPAVPDSMVDTTDSNGAYLLKTSLPGMYNIEAADLAGGTKALITGIAVAERDTAAAQQSSLLRTGSINVSFVTAGTDSSAYVYLPGTSLYAWVRSGAATIGSVPAGFIPALYYASVRDTAENHVIKTNITVKSGTSTEILDCSGLAYHRDLHLNTTASGANVAGNVYGFPLLVRLTAATFVFSQAQGNGSDLRFTKSDDAPLAFEIEQWDSANSSAAVWVRIDTVYGNSNSHYFTMRWGASTGSAQALAATPASNSAAVFDTVAGFQGVWHLAGAGNTTAADATVNRYHGTPFNAAAASGVAGAAGGARAFDGSSAYLEMAGTAGGKLNFRENGEHTVSAWVNADTLNNLSYAIVDKSYLQYGLEIFARDNSWDFYQYNTAKYWDGSRAPAATKKWVYLTGVRSGSRQSLYVDGVYAAGIIDTTVSTAARDEGANVMIGRMANDAVPKYFKGMIDEVRLSNVARSADWIKLCYMSQKADANLVVFK